jgi:Arc/MetJ-type ribon-helix-helix transcriptional regulator
MKTIETKIPDRLDRAIKALVEGGWFATREQVLQEAIRRFLDAHKPELLAQSVRKDVDWGLHGRS